MANEVNEKALKAFCDNLGEQMVAHAKTQCGRPAETIIPFAADMRQALEVYEQAKASEGGLVGWNTPEVEPKDAYGIDLSAPLVFRTIEPTSKQIHLRLGYYNRADAVFYESGEKRAWKCHEVTHWHLLPNAPSDKQEAGECK